MKKKIALLLAAAMTITAVPTMNVSAALPPALTNTNIGTVGTAARLYENRLAREGVTPAPGNQFDTAGNAHNLGGYIVIPNTSGVGLLNGSSFQITLENAVWNYRQWFVGTTSTTTPNTQASTINGLDATGLTIFDFGGNLFVQNNAALTTLVDAAVPSISLPAGATRTGHGLAAATTMNISAAWDVYDEGTGTWIAATPATGVALVPISVFAAGDIDGVAVTIEYTTTSTTTATPVLRQNALAQTAAAREVFPANYSTIDQAFGFMNDSGVYERTGGAVTNWMNLGGAEITYELRFTSANTVTILVTGTPALNDFVAIPLAILTTSEEPVRAIIGAGANVNANVSANLAVANIATGNNLTTTTGSQAVRGEEFIRNVSVTIRERSAGALRNGAFRLTAPAGFEFVNIQSWNFLFGENLAVANMATGNNNVFPAANVAIPAGQVRTSNMFFNWGYNTGFNSVANRNAVNVRLLATSRISDTFLGTPGAATAGVPTNSVVWGDSAAFVSPVTRVHVNPMPVNTAVDTAFPAARDFVPSTLAGGGILTISNITLENITNNVSATPQVLEARIDHLAINQNRIVNDQAFNIATSAQFGVNLERLNNATTLVSGRLEPAFVSERATATSNADVTVRGHQFAEFNQQHRAANVRIEENIPNSWWSLRNTTLTLPQGVRFLAIQPLAQANFVNSMEAFGATSATGLGAFQGNSGRMAGNWVTINHNVATIHLLPITNQTTARTRLDLGIWLTAAADFNGEVTLTLNQYNTLPEQPEPSSVVIANFVQPVTVETTVSDVRIGLQYVSVADFTITETRAGNLLQGKEVYITVSDQISTDMLLANGFNYNVIDGNLRISNMRVATGLFGPGVGTNAGSAQIVFNIDRTSSVASTIEFTNVQVKIGRTVPFSNVGVNNERGIDLIVWGPAIAQNFMGLHNVNNIMGTTTNQILGNPRDLYNVPGIVTNYINVIDNMHAMTGFNNVVEVTIGNPVILINGEEFEMPVAAYISPVSQAAMVPVRFVSVALGLEEDAVRWDPTTSTVTIDTGINNRIVQFVSNETFYRVNGAQISMVGADNVTLVASEIREERMFIPFRQLGNAFGIPVSWDAETTTAFYNNPAEFAGIQ